MDRRNFLSAGALSLLSIKIGYDPEDRDTASTTATLPLIAARMADDVCQAYMVNTKIYHAKKVYGHTDAVIDLVKELGARTIRERITTDKSSGTGNQQYAMPKLAAAGVRWHGTVGSLEDWKDPTAANKRVMDFLTAYYRPRVGGNLSTLMRSFGGCNEIDGPVLYGSNDPAWAKHARIMQTALWKQAKANPATAGIPVAGPSTRSDFTKERAALLGDLSAITEQGAVHFYNKGTSPTRGVSERLSISRPNFPDAKQWVVCETGYNNSPQDNLGKTVPEAASATYVIRGICDFFKRNALYGRFELLDDPDVIDYTSQATINRTAAREAHFGLVAMTKSTVSASTPDTWRKKAEFYSTQRFLSLLSDRGAPFQPSSLRLAVTGGGKDLQQLLVQKRNGKHYLVLWRDVEVSQLYPNASTIKVAPVNLTVKISPFRPMAVYEPGRSAAPVAKKSSSGSLSLSLAGDLKVVEIG